MTSGSPLHVTSHAPNGNGVGAVLFGSPGEVPPVGYMAAFIRIEEGSLMENGPHPRMGEGRGSRLTTEAPQPEFVILRANAKKDHRNERRKANRRANSTFNIEFR